MTIDDLKFNITNYHFFLDAFAEQNEGITWTYNHKDGTEWRSYSFCMEEEDEPNYPENWRLVFQNCVEDGEEEVDFRVPYTWKLYKEQFDGNEEKFVEWLANEIVEQMNEAGYSLDDFEPYDVY